ncbi:MAG: heavy-metal-associated domain-containing protein [Chloroflexi bacterium]|nr:heavy-metal-associated domain-containing protein [Chloroflexota bacterium]
MAPRARVVSREGEETLLRLQGIVCDGVCAVRTERALAAMPGVRAVRVDYEAQTATVIGPVTEAAAYERAIAGAVAGMWLRRGIERVARALGR